MERSEPTEDKGGILPFPSPKTSQTGLDPKPEFIDPARINFHITDDQLGVGGAKAKYADNIAAIRLLKMLEAEKRLAMSEEQEVLSRYVGWGSLPEAFDVENSKWEKEYAELNGLLTEAEYKSVRASTLNAHYTPL